MRCYLVTLFLLFSILRFTFPQLNECLRPSGCSADECCFNMVAKTGELCARVAGCFNQEFDRDCCRNSRVVSNQYGSFYGYAILLDDMYFYRDDGQRYLQIWLGIPYAKPPIEGQSLRFRPPQEPDAVFKYDATYYRPACPQPLQYISNLLKPTVDEDCLYLNIFVMNYTINPNTQKIKYPILVFLHGGEHTYGSPVNTPGHILAQTNIMVITVQYRLNVFGFLSTEDQEAPGNYGLLDQVAALKYIHGEIDKFNGDFRKVTLAGHGSGASDAALHGMSELTGLRTPVQYFHRALWMSGSDLTLGGFTEQSGMARRYALELGYQVGCTDSSTLIACLKKRSVSELAGAAANTRVHRRGWIGRPWSPVIDNVFIKDHPLNLRKKGIFAKMKVIAGVCYDDGANYTIDVPSVQKNAIISSGDFKMAIESLSNQVFANDMETLVDSILFQYTWWPDVHNSSMRLQMYRDMYSDWYFGSGLTDSLNYQADTKVNGQFVNNTQMYVMKYRSSTDPRTRYMGAYHGTDLQYLFGFPYLNNSNWAEMGLKNPGFVYGDLDKNMSDYWMYMISNFVIFGNATPEIIRNITWDTFRYNNRTYLSMDLDENFEKGFTLLQNYRMYNYAFWLHFYPYLLNRAPTMTTPIPTAYYLSQYRNSSISLAGIFSLILVIIIGLIIIIVKRRQTRLRER